MLIPIEPKMIKHKKQKRICVSLILISRTMVILFTLTMPMILQVLLHRAKPLRPPLLSWDPIGLACVMSKKRDNQPANRQKRSQELNRLHQQASLEYFM